MASRVLFGLVAFLTLGGAAAAAIGMQRSRELTGNWIGYGIPNDVAAMIGIGLLSFGFGLLLLIAASVAAMGDRLGLWEKLATPVLPESHPVARAGRGGLGAKRIWDTFVFVVLLGVVALTAFQSQLAAAILGCTALLVGFLYWILSGGEHRP